MQQRFWPPLKSWQPAAVTGSWLPPVHGRIEGVPQAIAVTEGYAEGPVMGAYTPDATLADDECTITIYSDHLGLSAGGDAGLRIGLRRLRQLCEQGAAVPLGVMHDQPAVKRRGFMLDVSRDRIPTRQHLREIVDDCARLLVTDLQLYCEHSFAYAAHATVWQQASPLTAADLRWLDDLCASRGIRLMANQNSFGHMERWLTHDAYADMAELEPPDLAKRLAQPESGCLSLQAHAKTVQFVTRLWHEQLAVLRSHEINIGCDETMELGEGRSAMQVKEHGVGQVYGQHVGSLVAYACRQGWRPHFWADIAQEHPSALAAIDKRAVALCWWYEADADFRAWGQQLTEQGFAWWACSGTSCWLSIGGRADARRGSTAAAIDGALHGAEGVLLTAWGDEGHHQQWPVTRFAMVESMGAVYAGRAATNADLQSIDKVFFADTGWALWLQQLSAIDQTWRLQAQHPGRTTALINATMPATDLRQDYDEQAWAWDTEPWLGIRQALRGLSLPSQPSIWSDECQHAYRHYCWAVDRALARRGLGGEAINNLVSEGAFLRDNHRHLWLRRSRPGGLSDSLRRWDRWLRPLKEQHG